MFDFFHRHIAKGIGLLIFSIIYSFLIRFLYFQAGHAITPSLEAEGWLWTLIEPLFASVLVSCIVAGLFLAILGVYIYTSTVKYGLLQKQYTYQPTALFFLFVSSSPLFASMSPFYIVALVTIIVVAILFESYKSNSPQQSILQASISLAIGSLFAPVLLFYIPLLWICLIRLENFRLKAILASLFGVILIYVPLFTFYLLTENIDEFIKPFLCIVYNDWSILPILEYNLYEYILLVVVIIFIFIVFGFNAMHGFKDKIVIKTYISILEIITIYSLLLLVFIDIDPLVHFGFLSIVSSLLLGHYMAAASKKMAFFFFTFIILFSITWGTLAFW